MNRILASFFLFATTLQSFGQGLVLIQFHANQAYITKTLCINRSRPALKCCGQCQLKKKLNEDGSNSEQNASRNSLSKFEILTFILNTEEDFAGLPLFPHSWQFLPLEDLRSEPNIFFRPPR